MVARVSISTGAKAEILRAKLPLLTQWAIVAFRNNVTPEDGMTAADFQVEPNAQFQLTDAGTIINTPVFNPPFQRPDGLAQVTSRDMDIRQANTLLPMALFGWYMLDSFGYYKMGSRFPGVLPKIVGGILRFYRFRIEIVEDSIH